MAALTEIEANEMLVHENRNEVEVNNFEVEEGLPLFLNSILDRAESTIGAGSTNMDEIQTCLVFVDRTISLLRLIIQEVDEIDKQEWHTIESCFELILQSLHDYALELACRPTTLTTQNCDVERARTPGRPAFYVQPETLEELLGLGFSKQKIAKILVCRDGQFIGEYNNSTWNI